MLETLVLFGYHSWLLASNRSIGAIRYVYAAFSVLQVASRALGYQGTFEMTCEWFSPKHGINMGLAYAFYLPQIFLLAIHQNFCRSVPYFENSTISKVIIDYIYISFCLYLMTMAFIGFSQSIYRSKKTYVATLLVLWFLLKLGLWHHNRSYFVSCLCFMLTVFAMSRYFPNCFTLGEYSILCQTCVLTVTLLWQRYFKSMLPPQISDDVTSSRVILCCILGSVLSIFLYVLMSVFCRRRGLTRCIPAELVGLCVSSVALLLIFQYKMSLLNPVEVILWFVTNLFAGSRLVLIAWWVLVSFATAVFVGFFMRHKNIDTASVIVARKFFHLSAVLCYVPGVIYDENLLMIVSAGLLWLFSLVECIRLSRFSSLGIRINDVFSSFLKVGSDSRFIIPNHFLLLVAVSLPLWIIRFIHFGEYDLSKYAYRRTVMLAGVVSCGVGDSVASVVGTLVGKHRILGSKKTYEGVIASFLTQSLLFIVAYHASIGSFWPSPSVDLIYIAVSLSSSIIEGLTAQEDNIILPILTMSHLVACIQNRALVS